MNIFYCITFLHFGAGRALLDLAKEAKGRGHEVVIAATGKIDKYESQYNLIHEAEEAGIKLILCNDLFTRNFVQVSESTDKIIDLFRARQFDIIHSHAAIPGFAASLSSKIAYGRFLPHISTVHAWGPDKVRWMKMQDVMFLNNVDAVHSVSSDVGEYLVSEGVKRSRIHTIYNGCNFARINDLLSSKVEASHFERIKPCHIGTIADLSERKGIKYLIDAVAKLPWDLLKNLEVSIIGDGPEKEQLIAQRDSLNLNNIVKFIGFETNPFKYIKDFDLFILPSLSEGLPVALVEAMYLKIPVLTTNVQGNREITRGNRGTVVPACDSNALSREICAFYNDRSMYISKTEVAFEWVVNNFNRQTSFDKIFMLYEQFI